MLMSLQMGVNAVNMTCLLDVGLASRMRVVLGLMAAAYVAMGVALEVEAGFALALVSAA
jgi:hypothetical protein